MINVRNAADFGINREIAVVRNVVERNVNDYVNALVLGCGAEILELILCTELVADFVARGLIELIPLADSCLAFADNACDRTGLDGCVACRRVLSSSLIILLKGQFQQCRITCSLPEEPVEDLVISAEVSAVSTSAAVEAVLTSAAVGAAAV